MTRGTKRSARIIQLRRAAVAVLIREHTSPAQPQSTATEWREGPSTLAGSPERRARPGPHKSFTNAPSGQAARARAGLSDRSAKSDQNGVRDLGCCRQREPLRKPRKGAPEHLSLAWRESPRHPFQRRRHAGVGSQPNREATRNSAPLTSDPRDRVCDFDG
jgi:hypothetical protein